MRYYSSLNISKSFLVLFHSHLWGLQINRRVFHSLNIDFYLKRQGRRFLIDSKQEYCDYIWGSLMTIVRNLTYLLLVTTAVPSFGTVPQGARNLARVLAAQGVAIETGGAYCAASGALIGAVMGGIAGGILHDYSIDTGFSRDKATIGSVLHGVAAGAAFGAVGGLAQGAVVGQVISGILGTMHGVSAKGSIAEGMEAGLKALKPARRVSNATVFVSGCAVIGAAALFRYVAKEAEKDMLAKRNGQTASALRFNQTVVRDSSDKAVKQYLSKDFSDALTVL